MSSKPGANGALLVAGNIKLVPECGALDQWRRELLAGVRSLTESDSLSRAACYEAAARDSISEGLISVANRERIRAAQEMLRTEGV